MRGVLRYRRDDVVAILDSTRAAGETEEGVPIVATVDDALRFEPDTALVGVATQGGRFPPAWMDILRSCIVHGLDVENGLHVFLADDPELRELAARHDVQLRDLRRPPADLSTATGANLDVPGTVVLTVGSDCAIGKMTVALELDLEARRRGPRLDLRAHRADGDRDRRLGDRRRCRRRGLHRRRGGTARRRGGRAPGRRGERRPALGRGPGLDHPSRLLRRDRRPLSRQRAASARSSATVRGRRRSRARAAARTPSRRSASSSSCTSASHCRRGAPASRRSRSTPAISARTRRARRSQPSRARPDCPPTTRFVSARGRSSARSRVESGAPARSTAGNHDRLKGTRA